MKTAYVVSGRLTDEGRIELDEWLPLPPGPIRVSVEALEGTPGRALPVGRTVAEEPVWRERKARLDALAGSISDQDAVEMLELVEREFEQVDLDEWR